MARKPRIEYEGAFYHVITRGNQRQGVFKGGEDFQKYISLLAFYKERNKYALYAYVLMSNHVHLLIETRTIPLSKILQGINQRYTMYFNRKYKTSGHLFQGRYKAILCDKDGYLLSLIKYIHLNPVRAKIAKTPGEYLWSSHQSYEQQRKDDIVDTDQVLRVFSENKSQARKLYRAFIDDGIEIKKENIYKTVSQRILGEEQFVDEVIEKTGERIENKRKHHEYSLKEIVETIGTMKGITLKQLRGGGRNREILTGRKLASLALKVFGYRGNEIAFFLKKDPSVITRYLQAGATLKADLERVLTMLNDKSIRNKQA
jgi:REP element-mobilizing transposase RayT